MSNNVRKMRGRVAPRGASENDRRAVPSESFTLGREAFAKVSALERVEISPELQRQFHEFDRKGLSAAERRRSILSKYGKKPA